MKKERIETLVDSFVDVNGDTRHFVIAAVSEILPTTYGEYDPECDEDEKDNELIHQVIVYDEDFFEEELDTVVKALRLGWAICNPKDKFDEKLGKTIAIGRARKSSEVALYATQLGYINTKLVKAFLEQEAEYFKANPETCIAGYKRKK